MKCNNKRCNDAATWLIGTARVGYCDVHASLYPRVQGKLVERVRVSGIVDASRGGESAAPAADGTPAPGSSR